MRMTSRALRTGIITATAASAITLGAASGALAATQHAPAGVTVEAVAHAKKNGKKNGKTKRAYVKTVKLASKGHTAKVYKLGAAKFQADVMYKGHRIATLTASGKAASANLNGLHVKLTQRGAVTSWVDRAKPAPKPKPKPKPKPAKRVLVSTHTLADGHGTAKVYKLSTNHFQADLFGRGAKLGTLDANGRAATGEDNGLHVVLSPDGQFRSWVDQVEDDPTPAPVPDPEPTPDPDPEPTPDPAPVPDQDPAPAPAPTPKPDDTKPAPAPVSPIAPSTDPGVVEPAPVA
ncbi:hypothetical protein AB0C93_13435 [Streptomyces sp. NPDC048518]|uniref:hypothetical protein n=1 Tax=Streptomyces sp. NPDC048518 TaxID=3155029 RepID=UPI0033F8DBC1